MKPVTLLITLTLALGLILSVPDAEARRLGGGMSSGMKRDSGVMRREAAPTTPQAPQSPGQQNMSSAQRPLPPATPPAPSGMSRWLGPLAGLAAGIGLASLFSHFGMGAGMESLLTMLLIGGALFLVVRMVMQRNAAQPQPYPAATPQRFEPQAAPPGPADSASAPAVATMPGNAAIPAGFDIDGFLRQAKLNFVRLQAANDAGNMEDIRAFTTPEMFAEVQLGYQERGKVRQQTDVVQLNAALLDLTNEAGRQIASVHFSGSIRETADSAPEAFDEVWHLARPVDGNGGWIVAGIQQFN